MKRLQTRGFLFLLSVLYILSSLATLTVFAADPTEDAAPPCSQCQEGDTDLIPYLPMRGNSDDYRAWAQSDSRWGSIPLGSSGCTVSSHGCLVTSVTKLIIQCGLRDKSSFDVGGLTRWLNNNNGFTPDGGLYWGKPSSCVSGFSNYGNLLEWGTYSSAAYNDKLISWIKSGYHLVLNVNNGGHWVAVDEAKSLATGKIYIMDSAPGSADIALTSRYSTFNVVHAYKGGRTPTPTGPSLTLSGLSFPATMKKGSTPELSGKITGNCTITWVWAGIDVGDTRTHLQQVQCNPMSSSFDITSLLKDLDFAGLEKGDYTLRIDATGGDQYFVLYTKNFRVDDLYMNLTGASIPTSISEGDSFSPSGKITSSSTITWVWVGVITPDTNKHMTEAQCNPMSSSYNINELTKQLEISSLPAGKYIYRIEAIGGDQYYILFADNFEVVENPCKNGHVYSYSVSKAPTTSDTGALTGTCSRCNSTTAITLPKLNTTDYTYSVVKAASCTATGTGRYVWKTTTYGKFQFDVTLSKANHRYKSTVTAPTCTAQGYTTHTCSVCGDSYKDTYTAALGHDYVDHEAKAATCTEIGWEAYQTCRRCDYTTYKEIPSKGHTLAAPVRENEIAPTCTVGGSYDEVVYCSVCKKELSREAKKLDALGHDFIDHEAKAATCTEVGWEAYQTCSRCNYTTYKEISALGHDWGEPVYEWADDYSAITATRVCKRDPDHAETENGVVTSAVTKEATYDAEGEITYTAAFANPAFEPQTAVVSLPRLERPTPTPAENPFTDIRESAYYHDPVLWAVANNVTNGTSASTFSPEEGCTRAQVVTFLWRAAGKPDPASSESPFSDVKEGAYYYNAVLWAVENGITNGTSDKTFSPDETCTRAQIVTFLWRYEGQPAPTGTSNPFADVKPSAYFGSAVLWAVEKGITNGTSATTFDPEDTCTRAQVVTFLYRDVLK